MREETVAVGIIGRSPNGHPGPVRTASFATFRRLVGELETAPAGTYFAGHAACHALMNGVERVAFCGVADPDDETSLIEGFDRLVASGPLAMIVAPGVIELAPALARRFLVWEASERRARRIDRKGDVSLWLDAPDRARADELIARQAEISPDPERVRLATPWVSTVSPGRRSAERLPPTCLTSALYLGLADHLRGVHEVDRVGPVDAPRLRDAGCALLATTRGRRRLVKLDFPPPRLRTAVEEQPVTLADRIRAALEAATADVLIGQRIGPGLWKSVERNAKSALRRFVSAGEIADFRVRCDEETNMDRHGGVGVEVIVRLPRRVDQVVINVSIGG